MNVVGSDYGQSGHRTTRLGFSGQEHEILGNTSVESTAQAFAQANAAEIRTQDIQLLSLRRRNSTVECQPSKLNVARSNRVACFMKYRTPPSLRRKIVPEKSCECCHGKGTYESESWHNGDPFDATCPCVLKQQEPIKRFLQAMDDAEEAYQDLIDLGVPKAEARLVLPLASLPADRIVQKGKS